MKLTAVYMQVPEGFVAFVEDQLDALIDFFQRLRHGGPEFAQLHMFHIWQSTTTTTRTPGKPGILVPVKSLEIKHKSTRHGMQVRQHRKIRAHPDFRGHHNDRYRAFIALVTTFRIAASNC